MTDTTELVDTSVLGPFNTAWTAPPWTDLSQSTHAVGPGRRIAVCGAVTASRGGRWVVTAPSAVEWPPCPTCAAVVKEAATHPAGV